MARFFGGACLTLRVFAVVALLLEITVSTDEWEAAGDRTKGSCNMTVNIGDRVASPEVTLENKGRSLHCWYRFRLVPPRPDWIINLRFYKFKVGRLMSASNCSGGYMQILDGNDTLSSGFFCGEVDRPQGYISETSIVQVVFHVDRFSEESYFGFESRAEQKFELYARHGPNPQLYPDRRGRLLHGTVCDREFSDCRLGTCYLQSPGFPGVYPRNLQCHYRVSTSSGYIKLHIENEEVNIDGQRCDDVILCPNRPVMASNCPYDYVNVYDGLTVDSPLVGSLCGRGKLPFAITGTGHHFLLVFVTSRAGPFLNTGFSFQVGPLSKWVGPGAARVNSSCDVIFRREDNLSPEDRRIHSLVTWYPPRTTCNFAILGLDNEIVRIYFKSFRVHSPDYAILEDRGCVETLTVYDSSFADESRIVAMFCDSWIPILPLGRDFVSTGNAMFIEFRSEVGSYTGSSLDYWIQFDYFNAYTHGIPVQSTECDELFPSSGYTSGVFSSPLNTLLFTKKSRLQCSYLFQADDTSHERVVVTLSSVNFTGNSHQVCVNCEHDLVDKIVIHDVEAEQTATECICGSLLRQSPRSQGPIRVISTGAALDVVLHVERPKELGPPLLDYPNTLLFQGTYEFLHGRQCGPAVFESSYQGELVFPFEDPLGDQEVQLEPPASLRCIWTILVQSNKSVFLRFESLHLPGDCSSERIEVKLPSKALEYSHSSFVEICGETSPLEDLPVITAAMLPARRLLVEYRKSTSLQTNFRLVWTEFVHVSDQGNTDGSFSHAELRVNGCSFVCGGSNACIPHELVCNGVRNCPLHEDSSSSDEDYQLCHSDKDSINWVAIGLGAAGGGFVAMCFIVLVHRCCRKYQYSDPG